MLQRPVAQSPLPPYAVRMSPRVLLAAIVAIALIAWLLLVVIDVFALW
jgi:hypothetical protein